MHCVGVFYCTSDHHDFIEVHAKILDTVRVNDKTSNSTGKIDNHMANICANFRYTHNIQQITIKTALFNNNSFSV